ncbi:uncharacterized protein [Ambystoma mexicanum]|uniref:uncharacterized protein n=1 Tax=Ambystoma mexicanum TaxID=8296 RepID=UPI0037E94629
MAPRSRKTSTALISDMAISPSKLQSLNRATLQQLCKKFKLKANGKTTELLRSLQAHYERNGLAGASPTQEIRSPTEEPFPVMTKSRTETYGHGWCLVHGMELRLPPTSWAPLVLRGGRACVLDGEKVSPLLLVPASSVVPKHLDDNYICQECAIRNQEKETWNQQRTATQDYSVKGTPAPNTDPRAITSVKRLQHKSGKYYPQENPDYARRVDEMLSKMAVGEMDSINVLCPSKATVVHSPMGKITTEAFP